MKTPVFRQPPRFQVIVYGASRLLLLLVLLLPGCKTSSDSADGSRPSRLASVVIKGHSVGDVLLAANHVFTEVGYERTPAKSADLVFDKQGSSMNTLVYGDWSGKPVWVRVKLYLRDLGSSGVLLDCDAFMVQERGDAHFEEEHKLTKVRRGSYQELLDKVSSRCNSRPSGP